MPFIGNTRFVGFGFGAIQAGLFVFEASCMGQYARPLVVDIRPDLVDSIRASDGHYGLNIARRDRVEAVTVGPVDMANSCEASDRARIIAAIAEADEASTALPSVEYYRGSGPSSPHRLIANGLLRRQCATPLIIYCAENHRRAAELLEEAVLSEVPAVERGRIRGRARFVNTVIGKMSGVITDPVERQALGLTPLAAGIPAAYLVEEFNHILTSRVLETTGDEIRPGMSALHPVADLDPYAAAKLFGHNATHALAAYVGHQLGLRRIADLVTVPEAMTLVRTTFHREAGSVLIARYAGVDPMFTPPGFEAFADDLLARMVNPYLADSIERAARDPRRKLGWDDRLIGLIRLGRAANVPMPGYALGVAAALAYLQPEILEGSPSGVESLLRSCWPADVDTTEASRVTAIVERGVAKLKAWVDTGAAGRPHGPRARVARAGAAAQGSAR